ncbi:MAG: S8 family peptidase [Acetobacteraceae bacterium]
MIDALLPLRRLSRAARHTPEAARAVRWRSAWAGTEGEGIAIGLLDAAFDAGHPDLAGADLAFREFAAAVPAAPHSHGTCSVTTLLGQGRRLVRGIVPRASLRVASVVGPDGIASDLAVARAIEWLAAEGVRLIMIPLGGSRASRTVRAVIRHAADAGTICFAAYGSATSAAGLFPARDPAAISVAAADDGGALCFAPPPAYPPDLIAPGWNITVALRRSYAARVSGSSLATVFAGGLAARAVAASVPGAGRLCRKGLLALLLAHHH